MIAPVAVSAADVATDPLPPAEAILTPTPRTWRFAIAIGVSAVGLGAYAISEALAASGHREGIGLRLQAAAGIICFLGIAACFSRSLQSVRRKTLLWGMGIQIALAIAVIHIGPVRAAFEVLGNGIKALVTASDVGAEFVFGSLAKKESPVGFVFAFRALPPIVFVSSFFSVLYYFGILQLLVQLMARVMMHLMGTSGAETLSVSANVFMGQTEAPLIVKPFVPRMTQSELLALMSSGMAHISGGMMAVYISYGADPTAILTTCVMACPCSLYLTKLVMPEAGTPETAGTSPIHVGTAYVNAIDAASAGVKDGLFLALNVAAMLIGFLAFIALFDLILGSLSPGLKLQTAFGWAFAPVAFLLGVDPSEAAKVGSLLGIKLAANEHVAYVNMTKSVEFADLSIRARLLATYALTGFANFASVGIQLGGIGSIAPGRRADLAKLGMTALFVGFLATLLNAAVAGVLM